MSTVEARPSPIWLSTVELPPVDRAPLRRVRRRRAMLQAACVLVTLFMGLPIYLITLAAFSSRQTLNEFPKSLLPSAISTETMSAFLSSTGVVPAFVNSIAVGLGTLVLALLIGAPAGYAIAPLLVTMRFPETCRAGAARPRW